MKGGRGTLTDSAGLQVPVPMPRTTTTQNLDEVTTGRQDAQLHSLNSNEAITGMSPPPQPSIQNEVQKLTEEKDALVVALSDYKRQLQESHAERDRDNLDRKAVRFALEKREHEVHELRLENEFLKKLN